MKKKTLITISMGD